MKLDFCLSLTQNAPDILFFNFFFSFFCLCLIHKLNRKLEKHQPKTRREKLVVTGVPFVILRIKPVIACRTLRLVTVAVIDAVTLVVAVKKEQKR